MGQYRLGEFLEDLLHGPVARAEIERDVGDAEFAHRAQMLDEGAAPGAQAEPDRGRGRRRVTAARCPRWVKVSKTEPASPNCSGS
ncbi:hypothetical protein GCM10010236_75470 [Streptomyces eurythermus]|nr:hypothetical protein GCM10010236_75470 [Streptomyces eurythermus]